jgi:hypothetical protein
MPILFTRDDDGLRPLHTFDEELGRSSEQIFELSTEPVVGGPVAQALNLRTRLRSPEARRKKATREGVRRVTQHTSPEVRLRKSF